MCYVKQGYNHVKCVEFHDLFYYYSGFNHSLLDISYLKLKCMVILSHTNISVFLFDGIHQEIIIKQKICFLKLSDITLHILPMNQGDIYLTSRQQII